MRLKSTSCLSKKVPPNSFGDDRFNLIKKIDLGCGKSSCEKRKNIKKRRLLVKVFPLFTAALSTPPDIWCQTVAPFLIYSIIEFAIFVALIVQVREEGWTSRMRESGSIEKKEE